MKKILLNEEEKSRLARYGRVVILRDGLDILITYRPCYYDDTDYEISIFNPYDYYSIDEQMKEYMKGCDKK